MRGFLLQVPRKLLQLPDSQGPPLRPTRSRGSQVSQRGTPTTGWPCSHQKLHLRGHIQENLRPKSPSFVLNMRTVFGGDGFAGLRQVGHFIVKAQPTSLCRTGTDSLRPRKAGKLPTLSKCASLISYNEIKSLFPVLAVKWLYLAAPYTACQRGAQV